MQANTKEGRRSSGGREGWGGSVAPRYNIFDIGNIGDTFWYLQLFTIPGKLPFNISTLSPTSFPSSLAGAYLLAHSEWKPRISVQGMNGLQVIRLQDSPHLQSMPGYAKVWGGSHSHESSRNQVIERYWPIKHRLNRNGRVISKPNLHSPLMPKRNNWQSGVG